MKVLITGGSGFIGGHLIDALLKKGHQVLNIGRHKPKQSSQSEISRNRDPGKRWPSAGDVEFYQADIVRQELPAEVFKSVDGIIHLAGENIFGRWSKSKKKAIYDSRILGTRNLVNALKKSDQKPKVFISASAVGYYGDQGDQEIDESCPSGKDFLAKVCIDWEKEAKRAEELFLRTVQVRTAPVLGHGGMLQKMLPAFRLGLGGPLGSGKQWFPWIHIQDIVNVYIFALENETLKGPINACSPQAITNAQFSKTLGGVLRRPTLFKTPKWALRLVFGELADSMLVSQKVYPKKIMEAGYKFAFPDLKKALENLLDHEIFYLKKIPRGVKKSEYRNPKSETNSKFK